MTIHRNAVERHFTACFFQFYLVCNFGKSINFGLGSVRTELVHSEVKECGHVFLMVVESNEILHSHNGMSFSWLPENSLIVDSSQLNVKRPKRKKKFCISNTVLTQ